MPAALVDKRNFCFMLHPAEGNRIVANIGLHQSSEDVASLEIRDAKVKLGMLVGTGVYEHIHEAGILMSDVYQALNNSSDEEKLNAEHLFTTYGGALISYLLDKNVIVLSDACFIDPDLTE